MNARKTITALQVMAAGGIIGAAIAGLFFSGSEVQVWKLDLNHIGAIAGSLLSLIPAIKFGHFI